MASENGNGRLALLPTRNGRSSHSELLSLFVRAGRNAEQACLLLEELVRKWPDSRALQREILKCEQAGDRLMHDILSQLHGSRRAPFHREDVYALASAIDDVVDYAEETADFFVLYGIEAPSDQSAELATILRQASERVTQALLDLPQPGSVGTHLIEIKRLERDGDRVSRDAIAALFKGGIDPMVVIRWKDIVERLEHAIDACEHVANVLEGILLSQR